MLPSGESRGRENDERAEEVDEEEEEETVNWSEEEWEQWEEIEEHEEDEEDDDDDEEEEDEDADKEEEEEDEEELGGDVLTTFAWSVLPDHVMQVLFMATQGIKFVARLLHKLLCNFFQSEKIYPFLVTIISFLCISSLTKRINIHVNSIVRLY